MTIYEVLQTTGLPVAYGYYKNNPVPPYLVYIGGGQDNYSADDSFYYSSERYQVELYFTKKDPEIEESIESVLLNNGYKYSKSEDVYIESDDILVIYFYIN